MDANVIGETPMSPVTLVPGMFVIPDLACVPQNHTVWTRPLARALLHALGVSRLSKSKRAKARRRGRARENGKVTGSSKQHGGLGRSYREQGGGDEEVERHVGEVC